MDEFSTLADKFAFEDKEKQKLKDKELLTQLSSRVLQLEDSVARLNFLLKELSGLVRNDSKKN